MDLERDRSQLYVKILSLVAALTAALAAVICRNRVKEIIAYSKKHKAMTITILGILLIIGSLGYEFARKAADGGL
jgi:hypothetical protein